jgi:hypothetical protein
MPILNARPPLVADAPALTFETALSTLIAQKWTVVSEGPSGAQLIGEKKMTRQTRLALIVGAVLVLAAGIGLIVMAFALIDYWMTKPPTHFLSRAQPSLPA